MAKLTLKEQVALENAPKLGRRGPGMMARNAVALGQLKRAAEDVAGKIWSSPNTALGVGLGAAGHVAGEINRLRPGDQPNPRIGRGHNAIEFMNNPVGGGSAVTLGNSTIYNDDPYVVRHSPFYMEHEQAHTIQGQQLGPLYLPSNIAGGLWALARDGEWHGHHNWNERGPQRAPPKAMGCAVAAKVRRVDGPDDKSGSVCS